MSDSPIFDVESNAETLIVAPNQNIGTLVESHIQQEWQEILGRIDEGQVKHVIFDLELIRYLGSAMIEAMLLIWKRIRGSGGRLAVCNASVIAKEVLELSNFLAIWSLCSSREEALAAVRSPGQA